MMTLEVVRLIKINRRKGEEVEVEAKIGILINHKIS
jgi:hypothetical protein